MPNERKQPFVAVGDFTVRRDFKFNGKPYARGTSFLWRRTACSVRRLRQMWESGLITCAIDGEAEVLREEPSEPSTETFNFDPEVHTVHNPERGVWEILDDEDEVVATINAKIGKKLRKASVPVEIELP